MPGPSTTSASCTRTAVACRADYAAAVSWFLKAAEQGLAVAQYNLGVTYGEGHGVPRDHAAAVSWYGKAAEQGLCQGTE